MGTKKIEGTSVQSYDDSMLNQFDMYDRMPYVWNADLRTESILTLVSGNIIKAYRCVLIEPYVVKH